MAGGGPDVEDLGSVKAELDISKVKVEELEQENSVLKNKLLQFEGPVDENTSSEAAQAVDSTPLDSKEGVKQAVAPDQAD